MYNIEKLEQELDKKFDELSDFISMKGNNYKSEEAEKMRREISNISERIKFLKQTEMTLELKDAIDILQYLNKTNLEPLYKCAISTLIEEVEKREET